MDIEELAIEIKQCYKNLQDNNFNNYALNKGNCSKAYCIRRIDVLREELLKMKREINRT